MSPWYPNAAGGSGPGYMVPLDVLPVGGAKSVSIAVTALTQQLIVPWPAGAYRLHCISAAGINSHFTLEWVTLPNPVVPIAAFPTGDGFYPLDGLLAFGTVQAVFSAIGGVLTLAYDLVSSPTII